MLKKLYCRLDINIHDHVRITSATKVSNTVVSKATELKAKSKLMLLHKTAIREYVNKDNNTQDKEEERESQTVKPRNYVSF